MSGQPADPVARWLAQTVAHHLLTNPAERPELPPLPEGITAVEAHAVGELDCGVVVTMAGQITMYFIVKVIAFHHPPGRDPVSRDVR